MNQTSAKAGTSVPTNSRSKHELVNAPPWYGVWWIAGRGCGTIAPLLWCAAERQIRRRTPPYLASAEQRDSDVASQAERIVSLPIQLHVISLAAVGIVNRSPAPMSRTRAVQRGDDLQPANRPVAKCGIGIAVVDIGRAVVPKWRFLPEDSTA